MLKRSALALCTLAFSPLSWSVPISYEGAITLGSSVSGSVGINGWADNNATETDFWSFSATAGDVFDIWALRSAVGLDTVFSIYSGTTTAEESEFLQASDWGGMTYLAYADDEYQGGLATGQLNGDPILWSFVAPTTGLYTIAIGDFFGEGSGPFGYDLYLGGVGTAPIPNPVPVPAAAWLFGSGLLGLMGVARRKLG